MKKFWLALVVLGLFSTAGIAHAAPGGTDRPFKARTDYIGFDGAELIKFQTTIARLMADAFGRTPHGS